MAAEYLANAVQLVNNNSPIVFTASIPCNRGFIYHEDETGIFILRGIVNNPCANFAQYQVTFNANIALPTGGTVNPIAVAITVNQSAAWMLFQSLNRRGSRKCNRNSCSNY